MLNIIMVVLILIIEMAIMYFILNRRSYITGLVGYIIIEICLMIAFCILGYDIRIISYILKTIIKSFVLVYILYKISDVFDFDTMLYFAMIGSGVDLLMEFLLSFVF